MNDNQQIQVLTPHELEAYEFGPDDIKRQVQKIQQVMEAVMKDGEHYGVIPGTGNKPTLLKPGAEKLAVTFRLEPDYILLPESVLKQDYLNYRIKCVLTHIHTGQVYASGMGSCNTREKKYRYRWVDTGEPVPGSYWKGRDPAVLAAAMEHPSGIFAARKTDAGQWTIHEQGENTDVGDLDNTIMKMACKRALVAGILNATAASDIFTQDLEDLKPTADKPKEKPPADAPELITKKEAGVLKSMIKEIKELDASFDDKRFVTEFLHLEKVEDLPLVHMPEVIKKLTKRLDSAKAIASAQDDAHAHTQQQQEQQQ